MFVPQKQLSIDEGMISYKGRLSFLQYLPKKPKKWGMKAWVLADSKLGYTYNWKLYCGKEEEGRDREPLGERVVVELLSGLQTKVIMCILIISTPAQPFANAYSPWDLVVVVPSDLTGGESL